MGSEVPDYNLNPWTMSPCPAVKYGVLTSGLLGVPTWTVLKVLRGISQQNRLKVPAHAIHILVGETKN